MSVQFKTDADREFWARVDLLLRMAIHWRVLPLRPDEAIRLDGFKLVDDKVVDPGVATLIPRGDAPIEVVGCELQGSHVDVAAIELIATLSKAAPA